MSFPHPSRRLLASTSLAGVVVLLSCQTDRRLLPTEADRLPAAAPSVVASETTASDTICMAECVIVDDVRPLRASVFQSDSADAFTDLGEFLVRGEAGDSVVLILHADSSLLSALGADQRLYVDVAGTTASLALSDLAAGATVYRFAAPDTVRIRYAFNRRVQEVPDLADSFGLVQHASGRQVLEARTPWVALQPEFSLSASDAMASASATVCSVLSPGVYCGVSVGIAPYAPGHPFGDFQSQSGTGASVTITVTFSEPVSEVTVTAEDPDFPGNRMIAYNSAFNVVDQVAFDIDNRPGRFTVSTRTVRGLGIRTVLLAPGPGDYVAYSGLRFVGRPPRVTISKPTPNATAIPQGLGKSGGAPGSSSLDLRVAVVDASARLIPNRTVTLVLQTVDEAGTSIDASAGHAHSGLGTKAAGQLSQATVNTGPSGSVMVTFHASEVSGPVIVRGTSDAVQAGADTINVLVPGLVQLPASTAYNLIGQSGSHPDNHFGTPGMIDRLEVLADSFYVRYSGNRLEYNDISLPLGGIFDLRGNWRSPHSEHRAGQDVDLRTRIWGPSQLDYIRRTWQRLGGTVHDETHTDSPHYHLRFRGS